MNAYPEKQQYTADDLAAIIAILREPEGGCPWDKVQTHTSIRMNFLEEAYEAVDAIDLNDPELLCEELGDVMMQVVFHAQIEREAGHFTFDEVCDGVCRKLIERHPHIFGGDESIKDWDSLKNKEKGRLTLADDLESVPKALPALMRAAKLQKRAARYGVQTESAADSAVNGCETRFSSRYEIGQAETGVLRLPRNHMHWNDVERMSFRRGICVSSRKLVLHISRR